MTHDLSTGIPVPATWGTQIEEALARAWPDTDGSDLGTLAGAIRYALLGPGKRIRPLIAMAAAEASGGDPAAAVDVGLAVEFIHAYSLVHDDLPCMDDDEFRRGRKTTHRVYGEATAVLVGDALQAAAFARLVRASEHRLSDAAIVDAVAILATAAGWRGMVGGQFLDVRADDGERSPEELRDLHERKTGALLAAAVQLGALSAGVPGTGLGDWGRFGRELGWLFQLVDDLLDVVGDEGRTGRPTGSDARSDRYTALSAFGGVLGLERACDMQLEVCLQLAGALPNEGGRLGDIATFVRQRDH